MTLECREATYLGPIPTKRSRMEESMVPCSPVQEEWCPECGSSMKDLWLNFTETVNMCSSRTCLYPMMERDLVVKTISDDMVPSPVAPSQHLEDLFSFPEIAPSTSDLPESDDWLDAFMRQSSQEYSAPEPLSLSPAISEQNATVPSSSPNFTQAPVKTQARGNTLASVTQTWSFSPAPLVTQARTFSPPSPLPPVNTIEESQFSISDLTGCVGDMMVMSFLSMESMRSISKGTSSTSTLKKLYNLWTGSGKNYMIYSALMATFEPRVADSASLKDATFQLSLQLYNKLVTECSDVEESFKSKFFHNLQCSSCGSVSRQGMQVKALGCQDLNSTFTSTLKALEDTKSCPTCDSPVKCSISPTSLAPVVAVFHRAQSNLPASMQRVTTALNHAYEPLAAITRDSAGTLVCLIREKNSVDRASSTPPDICSTPNTSADSSTSTNTGGDKDTSSWRKYATLHEFLKGGGRVVQGPAATSLLTRSVCVIYERLSAGRDAAAEMYSSVARKLRTKSLGIGSGPESFPGYQSSSRTPSTPSPCSTASECSFSVTTSSSRSTVSSTASRKSVAFRQNCEDFGRR